MNFLAETSKLVIEAESLEKLWSGKIVKDKKLEFEKSLEKLRKKHEKVKFQVPLIFHRCSFSLFFIFL